MKSGNEPIIIDFSLNASINRIWNAITRHKEMIQWYFENIVSFLPEVGFETQFKVQSEDREFTHQWKVRDVKPLQKITYRWKYEEYPGDAYVSFDLKEEIDHVRLRITVTGLESFDQDIPEFARESCIEGWNYFIEKRLKEYLEQ